MLTKWANIYFDNIPYWKQAWINGTVYVSKDWYNNYAKGQFYSICQNTISRINENIKMHNKKTRQL